MTMGILTKFSVHRRTPCTSLGIWMYLGALVASLGFAGTARADNAGFALAPRGAMLAIDARNLAGLLAEGNADGVRPVVEALAGHEALLTFDVLAKRCRTGSDTIAKEVFGGRVAFVIADAVPSPMGESSTSRPWLLGIQSDDSRCERVLQFLGAKMRSPGRFDAVQEHLALRRVGGWLLIAPAPHGEQLLEASSARIETEDAEHSLLGEPQLQPLLGSDAPVRAFARHESPINGVTTFAIRPSAAGRGLRAEIQGNYDQFPLLDGGLADTLDPRVVAAFESRAVMALASPSSDQPSRADAFWIELVPELVPPPAMRTNLAGERVMAVGVCAKHAAPALAFAWRVEDAEQASQDQEHYMKGVHCGLTRALESARSPTRASAPPAEQTSPRDEVQREAQKEVLLGSFLDRFVGKPMKLGSAVLCWETVSTPCGGWQVYASDPEWLVDVTNVLRDASCQDGPKPEAGGLGFCDGARAASLLRRWRPLVAANADLANDRVFRGLEALAETIEALGKLRFEYTMSLQGALRATVEFDPLGRVRSPARSRDMGAPLRDMDAPLRDMGAREIRTGETRVRQNAGDKS
jgi:hypothetical protein